MLPTSGSSVPTTTPWSDGMPSITKLLRLATLPETRRLIGRATASDGLRDVAYRARTDRVGLARDLADPAQRGGGHVSRSLIPAADERRFGLVFVPGPYEPIPGWALGWLDGSPATSTRCARPVSRRVATSLTRSAGRSASPCSRFACTRRRRGDGREGRRAVRSRPRAVTWLTRRRFGARLLLISPVGARGRCTEGGTADGWTASIFVHAEAPQDWPGRGAGTAAAARRGKLAGRGGRCRPRSRPSGGRRRRPRPAR